MERRVIVWANNYYGRSLGLTDPIIDVESSSNASKLESAYKELFEEPIAYMLTGTKVLPDDQESANKALNGITSKHITDWIYLLKYWVDNKFFVYTGDFEKDLSLCVQRTQTEMRVLFATAGVAAKDIALHTYNGRIIDILPKKLFVYPKGVKAHFNGRLLNDLASKHPCETDEVVRAMLVTAIEEGYLSEDNLFSAPVMVPTDSGKSEVEKELTAISKELPPKQFTDLIKFMPYVTLQGCGTQFKAVLYHMRTNPVEPEVEAYVNYIQGSHIDVPAGYQLVDMDDEAVIEYLQTHHGISVTNLQDLVVQPAQNAWSMTGISESALTGSAEELLSALKAETASDFTTLDVIIENYCKENGVDQECTIKQLISTINYEVHPAPLDVRNKVAETMSVEGLPNDMTLAEFVNRQKHTPIDPVDVMLDYMLDNPLFPEESAALVRNTLIKDIPLVFPKPELDIVGFVNQLQYDADVKDKIMNAIQTGNIETEERPAGIDESAYRAAEYMLREVRTLLSKDASFEMRNDLTSVLYVFLRLLMCDLTRERMSVVDFIKSRIETAEPNSKRILEEGIKLL